jgi:lysophospholipase L1-like esterase/predicted esterase
MMLSFVLALAAPLVPPLVSPLQGPLDPPPVTNPDDSFAAADVSVDGHMYHYRLLAPEHASPGERYPLILFLHGAGERGDDNTLQLTHFPRRMVTPDRRAQFPCFVLAPQCPADERWTRDAWGSRESQPLDPTPTRALQGAIAALLEVVRTQPIDVDRIYLTGLSMGGYGAFELALRHADWFAAVVPVCGGSDEREASRLAGLPLYIWHGDEDRAVPVARSRAMVEALRALGESPEYEELRGVGHDAWNHAYAHGGCLTWLFAQRRDPARRLGAALRLMANEFAPGERVAFLGDSITQAGAEPGGYVDLLRRALAELRPDTTAIPAGISGNKIADLLARVEADVLAHEPTLVFVYIGINDVWHSQNGRGTPREAFGPGLEQLCALLEARGARVVLATPSVIGERASGSNPLDTMLEDYAGISRQVARAARGRVLCDLHAAFRAQLALHNSAGLERGVLTSDGVHLNAAGNVLVATEAARGLYRALRERARSR